MSDDYSFDDKPTPSADDDRDLPAVVERTRKSTNALGVSARSFATVMTKAFADATVGGKQFDDVLKSAGLKLSSMAVQSAFKPVATSLTKAFTGALGDIFGTDIFPSGGSGRGGGEDGGGRGNCCCNCQPSMGGCTTTVPQLPSVWKNLFPFASGGVISAPSYFPMAGGLGLAGEAGPEAIMPLSRGSDGRLGVTMSGGGTPANITVQIMTPDLGSFQRSEGYLTGQIARAVLRGQRSL